MKPADLGEWTLEMVEVEGGEMVPAVVHASGYWLSLETVSDILVLSARYPEFAGALLELIELLAEGPGGGMEA